MFRIGGIREACAAGSVRQLCSALRGRLFESDCYCIGTSQIQIYFPDRLIDPGPTQSPVSKQVTRTALHPFILPPATHQ